MAFKQSLELADRYNLPKGGQAKVLHRLSEIKQLHQEGRLSAPTSKCDIRQTAGGQISINDRFEKWLLARATSRGQ